MPLPVWAALLGIAVAKKVVVFTAAKIYGFPRLYRKSQQLARWCIRDKDTLKIVSGRIGYAYRVPNTFLARWFGPVPPKRLQNVVQSDVQRVADTAHLQSRPKAPEAGNSLTRHPAPAACSKGLLARTLASGQHYFKQRGCSIPRLGPNTALRPLDLSLKSPAAAQALRKLGRPFNYVLGQSFTSDRSFACLPVMSS